MKRKLDIDANCLLGALQWNSETNLTLKQSKENKKCPGFNFHKFQSVTETNEASVRVHTLYTILRLIYVSLCFIKYSKYRKLSEIIFMHLFEIYILSHAHSKGCTGTYNTNNPHIPPLTSLTYSWWLVCMYCTDILLCSFIFRSLIDAVGSSKSIVR